MDIDPDIAGWIIEYFVRQPLEEEILDSIIRALPLPKDDSHLQKCLLLHKLEYEVSRRPVSERTLDLLVQLEEIEFRRGNKASNAMRKAFCEVAVDCTLRPLKYGGGSDEARYIKFFGMVKRVWRRNITEMAKHAENGGFGSDLLWAWRDGIEAALGDDYFCRILLKKFEGVDAEEAVRVYLREERDKMGPSFLELLEARVRIDKELQKLLGVHGISRVAEEETPCGDANGRNASKEKGKMKVRYEPVRPRRPMTSAFPRGAKITDSCESDAEPSARRYSCPSSMELQAAAKDHLPEFAKDSAKPVNTSPLEKRRKLPDFADYSARPRKLPESAEDCAKPVNTSPLKKRRQSRRWSLQEEDALRDGVTKFGKGYWKLILDDNPDVFEGRTEVDLKDKWRNMMRYRDP